MTPNEMYPPTYMETRSAEQARRLAERKEAAVKKAQESKMQFVSPQNLTQALLARQPRAHPTSTGLLGNLYQGFVRAASTTPPPSGTCTPTLSGASTPIREHSEAKMHADMERYMQDQQKTVEQRRAAEKMRHADVGAFYSRY